MILDLKEIPIKVDINNVVAVEEFTKEQYAQSNSVGMMPVFDGEKFYYFNGKMDFANVNWSEDSVFGVINNLIYKVSLMTAVDNKENLENSFQKIIDFINEKTNKLVELSNKNCKANWYFSDGNILLTKREMFSNCVISLTITSSLIENSTYKEKSKALISLIKSKWVFNLLKKLERK